MRRQLPVHSPITLSTLAAGLRGAFSTRTDTSVEQLIRDHWSARDVVLTDSGTSALSLAMSMAVPPGGMVALPAYACYDLATAADAAEVRVALYDVDPSTLAPVESSLRAAIAQGATAMVVVHLYGIPVNMDAITDIARSAGVLVIEDAAQAIGASWRGIPAGSHGDFGVLSFGRGKGLNAGGGGALLLRDADAANRLASMQRLLPAQGGLSGVLRSSAQWLLGRPQIYGIPAALPFLGLGETIYHPPVAAHALSRAARRMVLASWEGSQRAAATRRAHAERLVGAARESGKWGLIDVAGVATPGFLRLPLLVKGRLRADVLTGAARRLGVMPGYPMPLARLPGFGARCVNSQAPFAGAERLGADLVTLPTHQLLNSRDLIQLESWLRR